MPDFAYTARTAEGKDVIGSITAATKRDVISALSEQSLYPIKVEDAGPVRKFRRKKRIKTEVLSTNLSQLADLLQNGVPLLNSLSILSEQCTNEHLAEVLTDVRDQIADGATLEGAMGKHGDIFDKLTLSMVRAGSEGAFLEDALTRTAKFLEMQEELKSKVKGAMTYPAFLACTGFVVTTVLIVFFVPKFSDLFDQLKQQGTLPLPTVMLLWLSSFLGKYGVFVMLAGFGLVVWFSKWKKTERGTRKTDAWKLKLPVLGSIFMNLAISRFCRVLGTLLQNGVPLLKALDISSASTGNVLLAEAILSSAENISSGETLSQPLANCGIIPKPVMAMIAIAEESNNLENVLVNVADIQDKKIERQLDMMVRLVEPIMLIVMGVIVLFILSALLLPVFEMSSTIQ